MRGVEGRSRHCGSSLDSLPQSLHRTPIVLPTRPSLRPVSCDLGQRAKKESERREREGGRGEKVLKSFYRLLQQLTVSWLTCVAWQQEKVFKEKKKDYKYANSQFSEICSQFPTFQENLTASQQREQHVPIINQLYSFKKRNAATQSFRECTCQWEFLYMVTN